MPTLPQRGLITALKSALIHCKALIKENASQATTIKNLEETTINLQQQFKDLQNSFTLQFFDNTNPFPQVVKKKKVKPSDPKVSLTKNTKEKKP